MPIRHNLRLNWRSESQCELAYCKVWILGVGSRFPKSSNDFRRRTQKSYPINSWERFPIGHCIDVAGPARVLGHARASEFRWEIVNRHNARTITSVEQAVAGSRQERLLRQVDVPHERRLAGTAAPTNNSPFCYRSSGSSSKSGTALRGPRAASRSVLPRNCSSSSGWCRSLLRTRDLSGL